jgi:hypothetical protein
MFQKIKEFLFGKLPAEQSPAAHVESVPYKVPEPVVAEAAPVAAEWSTHVDKLSKPVVKETARKPAVIKPAVKKPTVKKSVVKKPAARKKSTN